MCVCVREREFELTNTFQRHLRIVLKIGAGIILLEDT
jgi:hypothetical protein